MVTPVHRGLRIDVGLTDLGWVSIVVTKADLASGQWLEQLARTLQRRAPQRDLFVPTAPL